MWLERPLLVTGITAGLCLVSLVKAGRVPFDYNLLHMQSKDLPAVVFEQKLIDSAKQSVLYCAVIASSLPEALALEAKITNLTAVGSVDSMARYLTEDQAGKLGLVGEVKKELAPIRFAELDDEPVNVPELSATLWYLQGYVGFATTDIEKENDGSGNDENKEVLDNFKSLDRAITQLRKRMLEDPQLAAKKLAARHDRRLRRFGELIFPKYDVYYFGARVLDPGAVGIAVYGFAAGCARFLIDLFQRGVTSVDCVFIRIPGPGGIVDPGIPRVVLILRDHSRSAGGECRIELLRHLAAPGPLKADHHDCGAVRGSSGLLRQSEKQQD